MMWNFGTFDTLSQLLRSYTSQQIRRLEDILDMHCLCVLHAL
jgi:hypothetical protein